MQVGANAQQAPEEMLFFVILSEAKNLSWFVLVYSNRREILRFAQNHNVLRFFAVCWCAVPARFCDVKLTIR